jgi:hypothetical protein
MTASSASMHPHATDGWPTCFERTARETIAERDGATGPSEKVHAALRDHGEDRQCNAGQAAQLLGYVGPDGSPNVPAFKMYQGAKPGLCQPWAEDRAALVLAALGRRGMDQGAPAWGKGERRMTGLSAPTPDSENARRCERRAFSSAAIFSGRAVSKLAPDPKAIKAALADPEMVLVLLGLLDGAKRQAHGYLIRCPWHSERTPSCSVKLASDGTIAAHCFGCGVGGDVLSLVAAARGLDTRRDFGRVVELAADLAGGSLDGYRPPVRRAVPAPRLPPPVV